MKNILQFYMEIYGCMVTIWLWGWTEGLICQRFRIKTQVPLPVLVASPPPPPPPPPPPSFPPSLLLGI